MDEPREAPEAPPPDPADAPEAPRRPDRRRPLAVIALTVLMLACLAFAGWGQWWLHGQRQDDHRASAVLAAAKHGTSMILSYDYRRLPEGAQDTETLLTGGALTQYRAVQAPLLKAAPGLHAIVSAQVKVATVLSADDATARVLLFVDSTSSSTKLAQPQLDQSRVVVDLEHRHGRWLISAISAV